MADFFAAIKDACTFWDSTTDESATVGGITLWYDPSDKYIKVSGFDQTERITNANSTVYRTRIACTDTALLFQCSGSNNNYPAYIVAVAQSQSGEWGAMYSYYTGNDQRILADGEPWTQTPHTVITNTAITQFIRVCGKNTDFIFEDIFRLYQAENNTLAGLYTLEGEKFVVMSALALRYTD